MQQSYGQQIANVHLENGFVSSNSTQKRKRENFKTIPPRPQRNKTKPKKKKSKESKTKTTREKKKQKQGNDRAMKKSFTATENTCEINPGNA
jgi:hypothetical protein